MARATGVLGVFVAIGVAGCAPQGGSSANDEALRKATDEIASLNKKVEELQTDLVAVRAAANILDMRYNIEQSNFAILDCNQDGYGSLRTQAGLTLLVSCENVDPYLDGVRVRLAVGNPTSAGLGNTEYEIKYNKRTPVAGQAESKVEEMKVSGTLTQDLVAGKWTRWTVNLPGVRPEQLGQLNVTLIQKTVSLRQ